MKIKTTLLFLLFLILASVTADAHYMWIETNPAGKQGQKHEVKIYYGEFSYDYREKVDEGLKPASRFNVWLVTPDNQKLKLECTPADSFYRAEFIPEKDGAYQIILSNEDLEVADWSEYGLGIVKQTFYSTSIVNVGENSADELTVAEINKLYISHESSNLNKTKALQKFKVLYNNKPLTEFELSIGIADGWIKKIYTDENGEAEFTAPWEGLYIVEAVYTEKTPGSYNGKDYENIRSVATYSIIFSE